MIGILRIRGLRRNGVIKEGNKYLKKNEAKEDNAKTK